MRLFGDHVLHLTPTLTAAKKRLSRWSYELSCRSRQKKFDIFWEQIKPADGSTMLNLGADPPILGQVHFDEHQQLGVEQPEQDDRFGRLRIAGCNLIHRNMRAYEDVYGDRGWHGFVADGCRLPFADKSFDVVFSNAVIEHVSREQQKQMADEIMRVGKQWFVTTPNWWYPIEVHRKVPLFHFLPEGLQRRLDARFRWIPEEEIVNLLSAREFRKLFPASSLRRVRVTFFPETLVVYGPTAQGSRARFDGRIVAKPRD